MSKALPPLSAFPINITHHNSLYDIKIGSPTTPSTHKSRNQYQWLYEHQLIRQSCTTPTHEDPVELMKKMNWLRETFAIWKQVKETPVNQRTDNKWMASYDEVLHYTPHTTESKQSLSSDSKQSSHLLPIPHSSWLNPSITSEFYPSPEATRRLHALHNGLIATFIQYALPHSHELDILIGGSTPLSVVYKKSEFYPSDMDIYIKQINHDKIIILDRIIQQTISTLKHPCQYIIIRKPLTMTWVIYHAQSHTVLHKIQLCLFYMNIWSEMFTVCHSDIVSTGYDIMAQQFVLFYPRWKRLLKCMNGYDIENGITIESTKSISSILSFSSRLRAYRSYSTSTNTHLIYFSNFLNLDTGDTLAYAGEKYHDRGFDVDLIDTIAQDHEECDIPLFEEMQFSDARDHQRFIQSSWSHISRDQVIARILALQGH